MNRYDAKNFEKLSQYMLNAEMTVYDAMEKLEKNGRKIAFLCDNMVLIGTVTDGDVRRFILNGGDVYANVKNVVNYNPIYLYENQKINYYQFMRANVLLAVPIVDANMNIVRIETLYAHYTNKEHKKINVPVVIMAGGKGSRLKPYTDIIPKPLIPIGDRTIIEHIMDNFASWGCKSFYSIINYKKKLIRAYFSDNEKYNDVAFIEEDEYLGTGGGLTLLNDAISETFILSNCDILLEADYYDAINYHHDNGNVITLLCAKKTVTIQYGTVDLDVNNNIINLTEKPKFDFYTNTGVYIVSPDFIKEIEKNKEVQITDVIQKCINKGKKVGAYTVEEDAWLDMGQINELYEMKEKFEKYELKN